MNQRLKILVVFSTILAGVISCDDIVEKQLDNKVVKIITPGDSAVSTNYSQTFWWEEVEGAIKYELQIVKNRFDSLPEHRLDTIITRDKFTLTLAPARYQWRVFAINGSSKTKKPTIQTLRIDSASIEGQNIVLSTPINNFLSNTPATTFTWEELAGVKEYVIELSVSPKFEAAKIILTDTVTRPEFEHSFEKDSVYYWRVTGRSGNLKSNTSEYRKLTVDRNAPAVVTLTKPANKTIQAVPILLEWNALVGDKSISYYKIYAYKTRSKSAVFGTSPYSTKGASNPLANTYSFTDVAAKGDSIFFEVRAVDVGENESPSGEIKGVLAQ